MKSKKGQLQFSLTKKIVWFIIETQDKDDLETSFFYNKNINKFGIKTHYNVIPENTIVYHNGERIQ